MRKTETNALSAIIQLVFIGIFMLQDAVYLNASAEAFKIAASRSTDNDITNITEEWYENYQR